MNDKSRAIFVDRDGVVNEAIVKKGKPFAPTSIRDFKIVDGSVKALNLAKNNGYLVVLVTNQPDVGNGYIDKYEVEKMHEYLKSYFDFDDIKVCYHSQVEQCDCRKPRPRMLVESAKDLNINLNKSFMVGDRKSDVEAGQTAGCYSIFIDNNYTRNEVPNSPDYIVKNLLEAVKHIITLNK